MGTTWLALMTLVALTNVPAVRRGWYAPYRPFRLAVRVVGVAIPPFVICDWLAVLTSGTVHQVFYGLAVVAFLPVAVGSLAMLLTVATAPSRRR